MYLLSQGAAMVNSRAILGGQFEKALIETGTNAKQ